MANERKEKGKVSAKNSSLKPRGTGPVESEVKVPCEVYSRIVGYLRPVRNWHKGKQQEFAERKMFRLPDETGEG